MKKGRKKRSFGKILGISLMAFALALSAVPAEGVIAEEGVQLVSEDSDFEIENGVLKKYNGSGGDVVIPAGVTVIGDEAFKDCRSLISVTLPDSVTKIGCEAFQGCQSLISVTVPDSVTEIGVTAFSNCESLISFTIPSSVTKIESGTFTYCKSLTDIIIPNNITEIGNGAFEYSGLINITIPSNVIKVGMEAFGKCLNLTDVTILNKDAILVDEVGIGGMFSIYDFDGSWYSTIRVHGYTDSTAQELVELTNRLQYRTGINGLGPNDDLLIFVPLDDAGTDSGIKNNVAAAIQEGNNPPVYNGYDSALISAIVNGVKGTPILRIEAGNDMIGGYISSNNLVDSQHDFDCVGYNLSLVDEAGNTVTEFTDCIVTLPLPTDWTDKNGTFWIGSIRPDGQFERITANVVDVQGQKCIQFTTNHFSEYGIVMETQKSQDQSDGTGDGDTGSGTGNGENNGGSDDSGSGNGSSGSGTGNGDSDSGSGSGTGSSDSGSGSGSGTGSSDGGSGSDGSAGNSSNANSSDTTTNSNNASSSNSTAAVSQSSPSDMSYMPKTGIEDLLFLKNTLVYGTFFIGAILFILSFKKRRI